MSSTDNPDAAMSSAGSPNAPQKHQSYRLIVTDIGCVRAHLGQSPEVVITKLTGVFKHCATKAVRVGNNSLWPSGK